MIYCVDAWTRAQYKSSDHPIVTSHTYLPAYSIVHCLVPLIVT